MENLTVVVPFWNGHATIGRLLDSLPAGLPVIVVDDVSDDPLHLNRPDTQVMRLKERGYFSGAVNTGMAACDTDVLVLNQDVWLQGTQWLDQLAEVRNVAIAGDGVKGHPAWPAGYVQGTFMYLNRPAWNEVGPLNAQEYPLWGATCEWQLRACRAGYDFRLLDVPGLHHERSKTKFRGAGQRFGEAITEAIKRERKKARLFLRTPPLISVIIPCHNYGRYLEDCINSLLGGLTCLGEMEPQTLQSFEAIIVDDASTDNTWDIIQDMADRKKGIRGLHLSHNRGTPGALNIGVEKSYGAYIQVLSADDMLESWALEKHYQTCKANKHRVVYGDLRVIRDGKRQRVLKLPNYSCDLVLNKNPMSAGIMYPRQAWKDAGGYPEQMQWGREDWAFNIALMLANWCGVHIEDAGYLYRREYQNRSLKTGNRHHDEAGQYAETPDGTPTWREFFVNQLRELYPQAYGGNRRMAGCCGGGRTRRASPVKVQPRRVSVARDLPGKAGMTRLEYIGRNQGDSTWWGPVTNTRYIFGPNHKVGYVDDRDLAEMLKMQKENRPVFRRFREPPKPKAAPVEIQEAVAVPDIQALTGAEIKALDITADQAPVLIEQEMAGKNRKTVLAYLEGLHA